MLENTQKRIVINAGHDDHDPGKVMGVNTESNETKKIRDELVKILNEMTDIEVLVVPDNLDLVKSIAWANKKITSRADGLCLDIHLNAASLKEARGAETFYAAGSKTGTDLAIAKALAESISTEMGIPNRGAKPDTDTFVGSLGWLRQTKGEATLVEICFMTNPTDWAILKQEGGHRKAAMGIAKGLAELWNIELVAPAPITPPAPTPEPEKPEPKNWLMALLSFIASILNIYSGRTEEEIASVMEAYEDEILAKKNVVGVGIGHKNREGELSMVVLVNKKVESSALSEEDMIPKEINGIPTDVIEVGEFEPLAGVHSEKHRPVHGGTSAIWVGGTACTLGAIVYKDGEAYAFQNTHCANPHWKGAKLGDKIIQPSPNDGGSKTRDVIGVSSDYEPLILDGETINYFDSALVKLNVEATPLFLEGLGDIEAKPATVKPGDQVWKSGRTTGVQTSNVLATGVTMVCNYGDAYGRGKFKDQVVVMNTDKYFTAGGDSSSLVVNNDRQPVGQIFAGSSTTATFSPIIPIMQRFGFTFDPEGLETPPEPAPEGVGYMALAQDGEELFMMPIPETIQPGMQVETQYAMNVRTSSEIADNKMLVIPAGSVVEILEKPTSNQGYVWAKVKIK